LCCNSGSASGCSVWVTGVDKAKSVLLRDIPRQKADHRTVDFDPDHNRILVRNGFLDQGCLRVYSLLGITTRASDTLQCGLVA